jgi:hypothetical protein
MPGRQQQHDEADPKRHAQEKSHDPTPSPAVFLFFRTLQRLANRLESAVWDDPRVLSSFAANARRIFLELEKLQFS